MMMVEADEVAPAVELCRVEAEDDEIFFDLDDFWRSMGGPPDHPQDTRLDDLHFIETLTEVQTSEEAPWTNEIPRFGVASPGHKSEDSESRRPCLDGFLEPAWHSSNLNSEMLEPSSRVSQGNNSYCTPELLWAENQIPGFGVLSPEENFEYSESRWASSDGFHESAWDSGFPHEEIFEPSSHIGSNGHFYMHVDGGSQNSSSSCQTDSKKAPFETPSHSEQFNFNSAHYDNRNQLSLDKNGSNKAPFETPNYGETSSFHSFNHVIQKQNSSDFSHLNDEDYLFGITEYNALHAKGNESNKLFSSLPDECSKIQGHIKVLDNPGALSHPSMEAEINILNWENEVSRSNNICVPKVNYQGVQNNTFEPSNGDDDSDLCILENISAPTCAIRIAMREKLVAARQVLTSRDSGNQMVTTHARRKQNNERVIFRVALQDLSQPKSETTPPDGVLSVPLLKHQRIALSWMANKETRSACCSGGILADDQGLGKTISTIALILKERSPSSKAPKNNEKQSEAETLNLDDEGDDGVPESYPVAEGAEPRRVNGCSINSGKIPLQAKGRPSGGTLIVCPTSVLRQWSDELHNKVTREADLSVLVYYGSNRTKDPLELAKYDVVVTTYAIVSMEVPKQPVVNENDDQIGSPYKDFSSCGKRKNETISDRKSCMSKKSRKGINGELLENISGPLAQVGWFRVVLDEAQSIKNYRTQVARACWGLRSKRRWCLSGTPIQNAIDDLYSYFRFLRHEPYAVFKTFCEQLKVPIHKNPRNGYKKLQAVLKTIMLRRTKGTLIDGEPIINLPPKTIELKKIDFSKEERDFYCRLEADSRAQFAEYAAAGTVKQNYVNILLMLLRLRQACDHPILVKGFNSNSKMGSSIEMAKKLSPEKQSSLLSCLEASLAICGICNDPPEDAVVTICGHVFCNQCVCEHVTGDDTQCPIKKCKTHLTMSCVFSVTTLRIALSDDQLRMANTTNLSDSEVAEFSELHTLRCPRDSSKIRAALDILLSLSKSKDGATRTNSLEHIEGGYGSERLHVDFNEDNRTSDMNRDSNNSTAAVGEKAIVFSQWTGMLDLLEACLRNSSIQYRRLDGTMAVAARDRAVKDFNSLPEVTVMIMSLKAASLGLNMVAACNVLLLDLWWNPTTEDQAIDRAHRIGQRRPVSVFRLTVKDTVEDRILALQQKKRKMVAYAFGEDETGSRQSRLTVEDLKYLFRVD